jgi:SAM-dependent methyltransferase
MDSVDCGEWLRRWERQQNGYLPDRERRFDVMLDVLEELVATGGLDEGFVALDLGCGPGSLSQRLLGRFAAARVVALDYDPVLIALGRGALGEADGRLRWVEADLRDPAWSGVVGEERVDAVLSTTALHWLASWEVVRVYEASGKMLRPGGVLLNGDNLRFSVRDPTIDEVTKRIRRRRTDEAFDRARAEDWSAWWEAIAGENALSKLLAEREKRFADNEKRDEYAVAGFHEAALLDAGFREVGTIWQWANAQVLMAVR